MKNKPKKDLTNKVFGRLIVIRHHEIRNGTWYWLCLCRCGDQTIVRGSHLTDGGTKSCGCLCTDNVRKANTKHGMSFTPTHYSWSGMKTRCLNKNSVDYENYGGRGIKICNEWLKFDNFYEDMGERPEGKTLERVCNDGDYNKYNCVWATIQEQNDNRSVSLSLTFNDKTMTFKKWADSLGLKYDTLWKRIYVSGWSLDKALTLPKQ